MPHTSQSAPWLHPLAWVQRPPRAAGTVLVVDDDDAHRELYRTLLDEAGYRVVEASDGVEGLRVALRERPGLVITDLHMPGMNGWELLLHLRARREVAAVPVVMVTSDACGIPRASLVGSGLAGLVPKPFDIDALLDVVARAGGAAVAAGR